MNTLDLLLRETTSSINEDLFSLEAFDIISEECDYKIYKIMHSPIYLQESEDTLQALKEKIKNIFKAILEALQKAWKYIVEKVRKCKQYLMGKFSKFKRVDSTLDIKKAEAMASDKTNVLMRAIMWLKNKFRGKDATEKEMEEALKDHLGGSLSDIKKEFKSDLEKKCVGKSKEYDVHEVDNVIETLSKESEKVNKKVETEVKASGNEAMRSKNRDEARMAMKLARMAQEVGMAAEELNSYTQSQALHNLRISQKELEKRREEEELKRRKNRYNMMAAMSDKKDWENRGYKDGEEAHRRAEGAKNRVRELEREYRDSRMNSRLSNTQRRKMEREIDYHKDSYNKYSGSIYGSKEERRKHRKNSNIRDRILSNKY